MRAYRVHARASPATSPRHRPSRRGSSPLHHSRPARRARRAHGRSPKRTRVVFIGLLDPRLSPPSGRSGCERPKVPWQGLVHGEPFGIFQSTARACCTPWVPPLAAVVAGPGQHGGPPGARGLALGLNGFDLAAHGRLGGRGVSLWPACPASAALLLARHRVWTPHDTHARFSSLHRCCCCRPRSRPRPAARRLFPARSLYPSSQQQWDVACWRWPRRCP